MCGIFGVLEHSPDSSPDRSLLEISAKLLAHRGPDDCGLYCEGRVGLAHTRLSLLDLSPRSNQPFWDAGRRYAIVYNGEIYNFRTLRADLERRGVSFATTSDTEVLLASLIHDGLAATLPRLEGMYAFALYDSATQSLALARDRFGIKPLFIYEDGRSFIFSSEIRAMTPWRRFEMDPMRAAGFLMDPFATFTRGFTLIKGVKMVPPGTMLTVSPGELARSSQFFSLSELWDDDQRTRLDRMKDDAVVDEVEAALFAAVEMQQVADAPVGALCSGGVDSSVTVAMGARVHRNIQIFHANTPGKASELKHATAIARHLGLELHTVDVPDEDHLDLLPKAILHRGNPFVDLATSIPFLKVSQLVRGCGVKAVLTGEGSDELFWGFPRMIPNLPRQIRRLPDRFTGRAIRLARVLAKRPSRKTRGSARLAANLLTRFEVDLEAEEVKKAVRAQAKRTITDRELQSLYELNFNLRPLLSRNDACGMASSIESRFPFLDYNVAKLAINLPNRFKARFDLRTLNPAHPFMIDKWVVRRLADRLMPAALSRRRKLPWPTGAHNRFEISRRFFENSFVRDLFGLADRELDYVIESKDHALKLKLLHLEVWTQLFLYGSSCEDMVPKLRSCVSIRPETE